MKGSILMKDYQKGITETILNEISKRSTLQGETLLVLLQSFEEETKIKFPQGLDEKVFSNENFSIFSFLLSTKGGKSFKSELIYFLRKKGLLTDIEAFITEAYCLI